LALAGGIMACRPLTLVTALSMGLLTYVAIIVVVVVRISRFTCVLRGASTTPPMIANGMVNLFGCSVRYEYLLIIGSIAPTLWITSIVFAAVRRHNREKIGLCLECGHSLPAKRGRCPMCGTRYERIGPGEPRFPIKLRHV
jgi:hypothetical protein